MKKLAIILCSAALVCSCSLLQNIQWDSDALTNAAGMALSAASISDAQVIALSQQTVSQLDAQNTIDNGSYQKRLAKLLKGVTDINGLSINYKVYKTSEVNAFACGDGSIRVYSGLMDVMTDEEIVAILGHECGHVAHQDTKKAMRQAYLASAARGLLSAAGGTTIATLSASALGDLGESYISSQYSQKQEYAADEYGFQFAIDQGYSPYSMYNALAKLVKLNGSSQASAVQKMFASHPDSEARASKALAMAESYNASK